MAPIGTPSRNMSQLFFSSDLFILIPVGQTLLSAMTLRLNDTVKQIGHLFTQSEGRVIYVARCCTSCIHLVFDLFIV